MKKIILASIVALVLLSMLAQAQPGCTYSLRWTQLVVPSPPYNACASEMTTTFDYNIFYGIGGYWAAHCIVINSGWDKYYSPAGRPEGHYQEQDTWHCTNLKNHQLQIDVSGAIPEGWKIAPNWLQADYAEDNPQNPEP